MQRQKRADIMIAGGGWVGPAMAKEIATRTSLSVVVLERGPSRKLADYAKIQQSIGKAMGGRIGGTVRGVGAHYSATDHQSTHIQGGAIMGTSPENSVVNPWFQHWRVPNLWVACRSADALVGRYLKRHGATRA